MSCYALITATIAVTSQTREQLLLYNHLGNPGKNFFKEARNLDSSTMLEIAVRELNKFVDFSAKIKADLQEAFELALAINPCARSASINPILQLLRQRFAELQKTSDSDQYVIVERLSTCSGIDYPVKMDEPEIWLWFNVSIVTGLFRRQV
jgi:hypothetical protein